MPGSGPPGPQPLARPERKFAPHMLLIAERHRAGGGLERSIVDGCRERLRPVLMTSLLAALGLVPAALSRSIGSETQRPIAVVIVFGTLSAAFLTLIVLPVLYRAWVRLVGERD